MFRDFLDSLRTDSSVGGEGQIQRDVTCMLAGSLSLLYSANSVQHYVSSEMKSVNVDQTGTQPKTTYPFKTCLFVHFMSISSNQILLTTLKSSVFNRLSNPLPESFSKGNVTRKNKRVISKSV